METAYTRGRSDPEAEIARLKEAIATLGNDAYWQAVYMENDRPYSSGPPSIHPVWSDDLRAESARLRDEGLVPAGVTHPWEVDPAGWPSADPDTQMQLVAERAEREAWTTLATAIGEEPDEEMTLGRNTQGGFAPNTDTGWGIREDRIITARDLIVTYGHQQSIAHERSATMAEQPETTPTTPTPTPAPTDLGPSPTHDPRPATAESIIRDALRDYLTGRAATKEPEGMER